MPIIIERNETIQALKEKIKSRFGSKFIITDEELKDKSIFKSFLKRLMEAKAEEKKASPINPNIIHTDETIAKIKKDKEEKRRCEKNEKMKTQREVDKENEKLAKSLGKPHGWKPQKGTFSDEKIAEILNAKSDEELKEILKSE